MRPPSLLASAVPLALAAASWALGPERTEVVVHVVDAATGAPIEGAVLWRADEVPHPVPGEPWDLGRVRTGADGRAVFVLDEPVPANSWWTVEAPGYRPVAEMEDRPPERFELVPGTDVAVTVLDVFERPVPGAVVEVLLGCGHTAAVRTGTTDGAGVVRFDDVDPDEGDWWVVAPGLVCEWRMPFWESEEPSDEATPLRGVLVCAPGPVQEGVVVDPDGDPVEGIFVGVANTHRGPWVRTDAAGRFRLVGGATDVLFLRDEAGETVMTFPVMPRADFPCRIVLREGSYGPDDYRGDHSDRGELVLSLPEGHDGTIVRVLRSGDGLARMVRSRNGEARFSLEPGTWTVLAGGGLSDWDEERLEVEIASREETVSELVLTPRPRVRVSLEGIDGERPHVQLATATGVRDLGRPVGNWIEVPLPPEPCVLRALGSWRVATLHVEERHRDGSAPLSFSEAGDTLEDERRR